MPTIGRPDTGPNSFRNIKMAPKEASNSFKKDENVGDHLNRIAGRKKDSQFVDKKDHNKMGKDGFLKLLSHQLQNQDPFKPADQKQFAADLAQFSQLEQLANMNSKLSKLDNNSPSEAKFYGASFIGKEVMTSGTSLKHPGDGTEMAIPFSLNKMAKKVKVDIFDDKNQLMRTLNFESMGRGSQNIVWDGYNNDRTPATPGDYRISVKAWDEEFNQFAGETKTKGLVTGVNFENGETILEVDKSKKVFLRDVQNFQMPKANLHSVNKNLPTLQKNANAAYNNSAKELN